MAKQRVQANRGPAELCVDCTRPCYSNKYYLKQAQRLHWIEPETVKDEHAIANFEGRGSRPPGKAVLPQSFYALDEPKTMALAL